MTFTHRRILKIIGTIRRSIIGAKLIYTNGSCYQFYLILKSIVPEAQAYYDSNHVITRIGNKYYDITGEVEKVDHLPVDVYYEHAALKKLRVKVEMFDHSNIRRMKRELKNKANEKV